MGGDVKFVLQYGIGNISISLTDDAVFLEQSHPDHQYLRMTLGEAVRLSEVVEELLLKKNRLAELAEEESD